MGFAPRLHISHVFLQPVFKIHSSAVTALGPHWTSDCTPTGKPPALSAPGALPHRPLLLRLANQTWTLLCFYHLGCRNVIRGHCWKKVNGVHYWITQL
jgi:hypothetical protein